MAAPGEESRRSNSGQLGEIPSQQTVPLEPVNRVCHDHRVRAETGTQSGRRPARTLRAAQLPSRSRAGPICVHQGGRGPEVLRRLHPSAEPRADRRNSELSPRGSHCAVGIATVPLRRKSRQRDDARCRGHPRSDRATAAAPAPTCGDSVRRRVLQPLVRHGPIRRRGCDGEVCIDP